MWIIGGKYQRNQRINNDAGDDITTSTTFASSSNASNEQHQQNLQIYLDSQCFVGTSVNVIHGKCTQVAIFENKEVVKRSSCG